MLQPQLLTFVLQVLTKLNVEFMITGSLASSLQGEPRSTHDIDLVITLPESAVADLINEFPRDRFYLDPTAVRQAVRSKRMFNLVDFAIGGKVDFWLLTNDPFDQSRFARRRVQEFLGFNTWFSAPEDTIIQKLRWARLSGGSERQFNDALRVYEAQFHRLDHQYLADWIERLQLQALWNRLTKQAVPARS